MISICFVTRKGASYSIIASLLSHPDCLSSEQDGTIRLRYEEENEHPLNASPDDEDPK